MKFDKQLIAEAIKESKFFILTSLLTVITTICIILQAKEISSVLNQVFIEKPRVDDPWRLVFPLLLIIVIRAISMWLSGVSAGAGSIRIMDRLRKMLMRKLFRLGPAFTSEKETGSLTNVLIGGVEQLNAYFSQYLPQVFLAAILPVIFLIFVFPIDWVTGVVMLLTAPLVPIFMILIGRASEKITTKQWGILNKLAGFMLDTIQGLRDIKTLGQSGFWRGKLLDATERYRIATMEVLRVTFLSALILELVSTISTAVIAVEVGLRLLYARMSFEQAFFLILLAPEFYLPLRLLGQRFHAGMAGVAAAKDIFAILNTPETRYTPIVTSSLVPGIRLQNVAYSYPNTTDSAVTKVNLSLLPGNIYALVGSSGSGKSTLVSLLLGFRKPDDGTIEFQLPSKYHSSMDAIGWISQRPYISPGTFASNVDLSSASPDYASIRDAVRKAGLVEVIDSLPNGIDTNLSEFGTNISGGQQQRLALARVYYKNSPIVLLDEPTSNLDTMLESEFLKELEKLKQNRIVVVIAHRQKTIDAADEVIHMDRGRIERITSRVSTAGTPGLSQGSQL